MFQNAEIWFQAKLQKRCCHLCDDRSCFSCGRSKTLSSALKTQGALPTLELLRAEFLCQVLLMRADIAVASRLALTVLQQHHPTLTGKGKRPMLLATCITVAPCQSHQQQQYESWCSNSPTVTWSRVMDLLIFATSLMALAQLRTLQHLSSVVFCCIRAYTLAPCLHNCFRMSTRNGKGAYAGVFLD